jgi:hypothetical protein
MKDEKGAEYQDLVSRYGAANIGQALDKLHVETFIAWLNFSLAQQTDDLRAYCDSAGLGEEALDGLQALVEHAIPLGRPYVERALVLSDLEVVTAIVRAGIQSA